MKALKKIGSLLLVALLIATMVTTAFAADGYSITIDKKDGQNDKHVYKVYQVFTGDLNDGVLSNVKYGSAGFGKEGEKVPADVLKGITDAEAFAKENFDPETWVALKTTLSAENDWTIEGLEPGYYLIVEDLSTELGEGQAYSAYIVQVVGDVEMEPKSDVPSLKKIVEDKNDSEGTSDEWGKTADHDIGDHVNYQVIGTLPSNYDSYKTYTYKFTDKMSKGLTYDENATITAVKKNDDGTQETIDLTDLFEESIVKNEETGETTVTWTCTDLKAVEALTNEYEIVVAYSCELNDQANIGAAGNPNTAGLEYSNNPNADSDGTPKTGKTPDDTCIVFTLETVVNKVDQDGNPLEGAEFRLDKWVADDSEEGGHWEENYRNDFDVADDGVTFTAKGLDDGKYRLVETVTPKGYNTIDPIEFVVSADHDDDSLSLGTVTFTSTSADFTVSGGTGETDVENHQGSRLPSTGGIGTTIFYIVGGLLVVGTGVLLIVKRRMHNEG